VLADSEKGMDNLRFDPDPEWRAKAVLMGSHRRLGQASPLRVLDPEVMGLIARDTINPTVERPIYPFQNPNDPNDTVDLSPRGRPQSPYVCTIVDDGVVVFRGAVPLPDLGNLKPSRLTYTSRLKEDMCVRFYVTLHMSTKKDVLKISEILYEGDSMQTWSHPPCSTEAELKAFRASNKIGVELHLSMTKPMEVQRGPWTPIEVHR